MISRLDSADDEYYDHVNDACVPQMYTDPVQDTGPGEDPDTGVEPRDPSSEEADGPDDATAGQDSEVLPGVSLSPSDGTATDPRPPGYGSVFGLTSAWGELYGVTDKGELIEIDPTTGESTLVHTFDHQWYGAASTPRRDKPRDK